MKAFLGVTGILLLLVAVGIFFSAEMIMQQTLGATVGIMGAVMLGSAAIIEAIGNLPHSQALYNAQLDRQARERQAREAAAAAAQG